MIIIDGMKIFKCSQCPHYEKLIFCGYCKHDDFGCNNDILNDYEIDDDCPILRIVDTPDPYKKIDFDTVKKKCPSRKFANKNVFGKRYVCSSNPGLTCSKENCTFYYWLKIKEEL